MAAPIIPHRRKSMKADMLLPVTVRNQPIWFAFQPDGVLRDKVRRAVSMGVVKVIAGPEQCHLIVDVKRPYYKPVATQDKAHD